MALIVVGLGWVAGLVAVGAFGAPWWMGGAWTAAGTPIAFATGWFGGRQLSFAAAAGAALLSGWWLAAAGYSPPSWADQLGQSAIVTGRVVSEPNRGDVTTGYTIEVDSIEVGGERYEGGRVLAFLHQYAEYLPGDGLTLRGDIEEPPQFEGFDYRAYLAGQGISATIFRPDVLRSEAGDGSFSRWLTRTRLRLDESLQRALPAPEAALAGGIAFGRDDELSDESKEDFNRSGLRHLVAVSGSNVSLVAALTYALAVPMVGRRWAWLPAAVTIAAYLCAAGLSASVFRAGIMAGVLLAGTTIGRPQSGLPALFAAVMVMTAIHPRLALEPGFQLSATATAGLITLSPRIQAALLAGTAKTPVVAVPQWLCATVALTTAASLATAPIMWVTFDQISLVSPVANAIVQPVFAVAFWMSVGTAVLDLFSQSAAEVAALAAYYPLAFIESVAGLFGSPRWAAVGLSGGSATTAIAPYAVLCATRLTAYRYQPGSHEELAQTTNARKAGQRVLAYAAVGALVISIVPVSLLARGGPGVLEVSFMDVGQGDAILVTTPRGRQVLIDGGPSGGRVVKELAAAMPHWDRTIDGVMLTHPQEDHVAGLIEVMERFDVGREYTNGAENNTTSYSQFERLAERETPLQRGEQVEIDGVVFEVLWPGPNDVAGAENLNNTSLVLRVRYGETTFLFTGDSEAPVHAQLAGDGELAADVLKVPHHGSKTTEAWFFPAVRPAIAVISVGEGNVYGHPHAETLSNLAGVRTFRTDVSGTVTIRSDGHRLRVTTER